MPDFKQESDAAGKRVDAYLETIKRLEPDIFMCDRDATLTSIAISLKRIADSLFILETSYQNLMKVNKS